MTPDPATYWRTNTALKHITANENDPNPEGFDVGEVLAGVIHEANIVIDYGCGTGRFTGLFQPDQYLGLDINPAAIEHCREKHPDYLFLLSDGARLKCDLLLLYTVCLHLSNNQIITLLQSAQNGPAQRILIAEITGKEWRRSGTPPVFNRDRSAYIDLLTVFGYSLTAMESRPYARYASDPNLKDRNTNIDFMLFARIG